MESLEKIRANLELLGKTLGQENEIQETFFELHLPVKYKELTFYPIKTAYLRVFGILSSVFFFSKYDSKLPEVMGLTNLQFLGYQNPTKGIDNASVCLPLLEALLLLCMNRFDDFLALSKGEYKEHFILFLKDDKGKLKIRIGGKDYNWKDYDAIKDIICRQNSVELPDYRIHPDIRKKLEEKDKLLSNSAQNKIGSFEELVDALMVITHFSEEQIYNFSIRRFKNLLKRYDIITSYKLMTILSPDLEKKTREKIIPWNAAMPDTESYLSKVSKLEDITSSLGGVENKISYVNKSDKSNIPMMERF